MSTPAGCLAGGSAASFERRLGLPPLGFFGGLQGERFELCDELAEAAVVLEPGLVARELFGGEPAGDGLAVDFARPGDVRAVEAGRIGVAAAGRFAAAVHRDVDRAGEDVVDRGELCLQLLKAGFGR
jgi:hypothetical protein